MSRTIESIDSEIRKHEQKISDLMNEKKRLAEDTQAMTVQGQLAIKLHDKFCRWNHIDGCGWDYEFVDSKHNWNGYAHKEYWNKAGKILKSGVDPKEAIKFMELV